MRICLSCEGISDTDLQECGACGTTLLDTDSVHYPLRRGEEDAGNPLLGQRIDGKFRVTNVLGKGGMGTVFRAVHEVSLVPVALKVLHARYAARGAYRQAFLAEARKAGRVVHEHCARILDVGEADDGTVYIAMEMVEGQTLDDWIHSEDGVDPATLVEILAQICRALSAAHALGMVHRDLSTRNVMVLPRKGRPSVKILDFGIAKGPRMRGGGHEGGHDTSGFANPAYSAPEQLAGQEVDARADLYSLGVIAFEALTKTLPVQGETAEELVQATVAGRLLPLPSLPGVPGQLTRLVARLLARDPELRPNSANEVLATLEHLQRPRGASLRTVALGAVLLSVLVLSVAYTSEPTPFLRPVSGSPLSIAQEPLGLQSVAHEIRSDLLSQLRFDFAGFSPDELRADISRRGVSVASMPLRPSVSGEEGQLTLNLDQPLYAALVERLVDESKSDGAVDLTFRIEDPAPLGYAHVFVDDAPPELSLEVQQPGSGLVPGTRLRVRADDHGTIAELLLRIEYDGRAATSPIAIRSAVATDGDLPLGSLLPELEPGELTSARGLDGPVSVRVIATDLAGHSSEKELEFPFADLSVPRIAGVASMVDGTGSAAITYAGAAADLFLSVDEVEEGLRVQVEDPGGQLQDLEVAEAVNDGTLALQLPVFPGGFADGSYRFQLTDRAGNQSEIYSASLRFRTREVEPLFESVAGGLFVMPDLIFSDGGAGVVRLQCNVAYVPDAAEIEAAGVSRPLDVEAVADHRFEIRFAPLPDGEHELRLRMLDTSSMSIETVSRSVLVREDAMQLKLPADLPNARFLEELQSMGLFAGGDRLEQGGSWILEPPDARLLEGRVLFGDPESPTELDLPPGIGRQGPLFRGLSPRNGVNVLDLTLSDVLGRPVRVVMGDREVEAIDSTGACRVARFHYSSTKPSPRESVLLVEHGQPTELVIQSPLPFEPGDDISLHWSQRALAPDRVTALPRGTELSFVLPFEDLQRGAEGLQDVPREEYGLGGSFRLDVELLTPAGREPLGLEVRTSRSVLPQVRIGEMGTALPEELVNLRMVPMLAPGTVFPDPVPDHVGHAPSLSPHAYDRRAEHTRRVPPGPGDDARTVRGGLRGLSGHGRRRAWSMAEPRARRRSGRPGPAHRGWATAGALARLAARLVRPIGRARTPGHRCELLPGLHRRSDRRALDRGRPGAVSPAAGGGARDGGARWCGLVACTERSRGSSGGAADRSPRAGNARGERPTALAAHGRREPARRGLGRNATGLRGGGFGLRRS